MWVALNKGFFSIVESKADDKVLAVRARLRGDLERVWATEMMSERAAVTETPDRDYRFRTFLSRRVVAEKIRREVLDIDYNNFKNSVEDKKLSKMYTDIWTAAYDHQEVGF